jgi:hypothetical protein
MDRVAIVLALAALALVAGGCGSGSRPAPTLPSSELRPLRQAARSSAAHRAATKPERRLVIVPRLLGLRFDQAIRTVHRAGLRETEHGFTGALGNPNFKGSGIRIVSQSPPPGTRMRRGGTVAIHEGIPGDPQPGDHSNVEG